MRYLNNKYKKLISIKPLQIIRKKKNYIKMKRKDLSHIMTKKKSQRIKN